jgi:hypothetical protein
MRDILSQSARSYDDDNSADGEVAVISTPSTQRRPRVTRDSPPTQRTRPISRKSSKRYTDDSTLFSPTSTDNAGDSRDTTEDAHLIADHDESEDQGRFHDESEDQGRFF